MFINKKVEKTKKIDVFSEKLQLFVAPIGINAQQNVAIFVFWISFQEKKIISLLICNRSIDTYQ